MRNICKLPPLQELSLYKKTFDATYYNLSKDLRKLLKQRLLQEQGFLCCYCMQRISARSMRVEHWWSQEHYPALQLDYGNLLAACQGHIGKGGDAQTICDVHKKNKKLKYNPAAHDVESTIKYSRDGTIFSEDDKDFSEELKDVLNLNCGMLLNNRKAVYQECTNDLKKWTPHELQNKIAALKDAEKLTEYLGVKLYILQKLLQRLEKSN